MSRVPYAGGRPRARGASPRPTGTLRHGQLDRDLARLMDAEGVQRPDISRALGCSESTICRLLGARGPGQSRRYDYAAIAAYIRATGATNYQAAAHFGCAPRTAAVAREEAGIAPGRPGRPQLSRRSVTLTRPGGVEHGF